MSYIINTENAPVAIGPYVQAVNLDSMILISGQIPICPKSGQVADNIAAQTRQSLDNIKAIVEAAGLKVAYIVKTMVFLKDLNDFATVNAIYEAFFTEHNAQFPARSCVEVSRLPKDVKIEIEAIAFRR
ncbi:MAG: enamine/imine deaminase, redox regulated chaperone [Sodalis sp. Ffu]|nr:MAG: enamine/imine deaminase, redox regulated chaperone [Sodalis sp. Ffu]